jgi:carbon monoxide dehydrogenase subunit G
MEIEGTYTLQAPAEDVWNCLMDGHTIQHAVPGLERLSKTDEHSYTFAIHIRHAPLRGTYTGNASILEPAYPSSYRLSIEGEGPGGKFQSECSIQLKAQNQNTVVSYQGHVQFERGNALIAAPLVKATIRVLLQHFFTILTDQLRAGRADPIYLATLEEMDEGSILEEQISAHPSARQQSEHTPLYQLVHLLRLGRQNPDLEERWVRRLRQVGIVTVLLLLVWIGTRLPRRFQAIR